MKRSDGPQKMCNGPSKVLRQNNDQNLAQVRSKKYKVPIPNYKGSLVKKACGLSRRVHAPLHDPKEERALILYSPKEMSEHEKLTIAKENVEVPVVCDPCLSKFLRPHQREGVKFMYDCVTGAQIKNNYGCIMADEMGLGKTLQCITLIWTLLRQSPRPTPHIKFCIIITPSSLVKNWSNEFTKWLPGLVNTIDIDSGNKKKVDSNLEIFKRQNYQYRVTHPVLIISYETLRSHIDIFSSFEMDLMICDEGHRLKNSENLTYKSLLSLKVKQKILLSATPVQNDLLEYFSLINFVNSGILGGSTEFKRKYETPIQRGRDKDASDKEVLVGEQRRRELIVIVEKCLIRRTQALLTKYLPVKVETIVCCEMTSLQHQLYQAFLKHHVSNLSGESQKISSRALSMIIHLRKLCNHPNLLYDYLKEHKMNEMLKMFDASKKHFVDPASSGKMNVLYQLLTCIKKTTDDRVIIVSNFTQTLEILEKLCCQSNFGFIRLDGSMTSKKRDKVVKSFNNKEENIFILMLSSKAGGCGLNLIGGNRLILFDPDWNPANDDQAAARIWRDGQLKISYVYRFLATGTIDEKIYQRQQHKKSLSKSIIDTNQVTDIEDVERVYSSSDLRKLFENIKKTKSETHECLDCKRCVNNYQVTPPDENSTCEMPLAQWNHYTDKKHLRDVILKMSWSSGVSFVFEQVSHHKQIVTV